MKRRSARPFAVEIKHSRSVSSSSHDILGRSGESFRWSIPSPERVDAPELTERPKPAETVKRAEPPARRVLPALTPSYVPSEPEPAEPEAAETPVRRRTVRRRPSTPAPVESTQPVPPAAPELAPTQRPAAATETETAAPKATHVPVVRSSGRNTTDRNSLRLGERWKHRLPRACR